MIHLHLDYAIPGESNVAPVAAASGQVEVSSATRQSVYFSAASHALNPSVKNAVAVYVHSDMGSIGITPPLRLQHRNMPHASDREFVLIAVVASVLTVAFSPVESAVDVARSVVAASVLAPLWRASTVLQTQNGNPSVASGDLDRCKGVLQCWWKLCSEQGFLSLWHGFSALILYTIAIALGRIAEDKLWPWASYETTGMLAGMELNQATYSPQVQTLPGLALRLTVGFIYGVAIQAVAYPFKMVYINVTSSAFHGCRQCPQLPHSMYCMKKPRNHMLNYLCVSDRGSSSVAKGGTPFVLSMLSAHGALGLLKRLYTGFQLAVLQTAVLTFIWSRAGADIIDYFTRCSTLPKSSRA